MVKTTSRSSRKTPRAQKRGPIVAVIPARGGSLRVPNKNLRELGGHPLIAWTIKTALKSKLLDRVIVSTDSEEIAKVAQKYGAEVPFLRPKEISGPLSTELQFHQHALDWLQQHEAVTPLLIVNLYPTAPFRRWQSIDKAISRLLKHPKAHSLRSIRLCSEHPFKMWRKQGNWLTPFVRKRDSQTQTYSFQQLPQVHIQNANIYITKPTTMKSLKSTVGKRVLAFEMEAVESVDINDSLDLDFAETVLAKGLVLSHPLLKN